MNVEAAVRRDVGRLSADLQESALAYLAISLAQAIDRKPTALMAKELREVWDRLRELSPPKRQEDAVDELRARRSTRRA